MFRVCLVYIDAGLAGVDISGCWHVADFSNDHMQLPYLCMLGDDPHYDLVGANSLTFACTYPM